MRIGGWGEDWRGRIGGGGLEEEDWRGRIGGGGWEGYKQF